MSADQNAAASGAHCCCQHNERQHPSYLDGECAVCHCIAYRPVQRVTAVRHAPVPLPAGERHLVSAAWMDGLIAEIDSGPRVGGSHDHRKRRP